MRFVCLLLLGLLGRATAGELWVAVGDAGLRVTSFDGELWPHEQKWSDQQDPLCAVTYGRGRFIAVGGTDRSGRLLASTDGQTWRGLACLPKKISAIAFGQNRFLAAQGPQLLVSTDGETFIAGDRLETKAPARALQIACGDTEAGFRFVILGESEPFPNAPRDYWRAVTTDGTRVDSFTPQPRAIAIAYGAGHFVAVGRNRIESSHDGENWSLKPCPGHDFRSVVWTGARFIATADAAIWTSSDALTWRREKAIDPLPILWAREAPAPLAFGINPAGKLATTRDFQTWKPLPLDTARIRAIAHRADGE